MNSRINIVGDYKKTGLTKKQLEETIEAVFFEVDSRLRGNDTMVKNINIAFVEPKEIQKLNKKYRKIDKPTDVLSFDYKDEGDVVLNLNSISGMKEDSETLAEAVQKTLIHGVLHLFGYDHENVRERDIMEKLEEKIFKRMRTNYKS